MALQLCILIAFLVVSAAFEVAETSLVSVNPVRLHGMVSRGDKRAATVERLRKDMRRVLSALLLAMTLCDIAATAVATILTHDLFGDAAITVETLGLSIVVLIFVRIIPKSYAIGEPERWARRLAVPVAATATVLGPVVAAINVVSRPFLRSVSGAKSLAVSEEEIKTMANLGVKTGAVESGEKELIERVFLFNDITAGDVFTPKEVMVALDGDKPLTEHLAVMDSSKFSRYPVWSGSKENIVGIVHIKDAFERLSSQAPAELATVPVRDLAQSPVFVAETELIDDLFRLFKKKKVHMAIVTDKDGKLAGLVTLEDLLEELVGEISDESDIDENVFKRVDKHTILVHGDMEIPDVNRFFNVRIPLYERRTIGRLILSKIDGAPKAGRTVVLTDDVAATIEQVSRRRILRVRLSKNIDLSKKDA
jgi:putative hemolysin